MTVLWNPEAFSLGFGAGFFVVFAAYFLLAPWRVVRDLAMDREVQQ